MNTNSTFKKLTVVFLLVNLLFGFNVTANAQSNISVTVSVKDETCYKANDVQLTIIATGGAGGYTYSIDEGKNFSSNNVFGNLKGDETYVIVVKDKAGNSNSIWKIVAAVNPINLRIDDVSDATCSQANGGYIKFGATGGTGRLTYSINNGATFQSSGVFYNLRAGSYNIMARDANGCNSEIQIVIVGGPFETVLSGDTTVGMNENFNLKITITEKIKSSTKNLYTVIYKNSLGEFFKINDLKAGENIIVHQAKEKVSYALSSATSQSGCKGYISGDVTITVNQKYVWTGKNSNWNDAKNWSNGTVPSANSEVVIPVTKINPVITGDASVKNITIEQDANLQIAGVLHMSDAIVISEKGSVNAMEGTIDYCGNSIQKLDGGMFVDYAIKNVIIGNRVDLVDSLNVFGSVSFSGKNKILNTNDVLTLRSTATETARVGQIVDGNKITGKVTVEQYVPSRKGWKFLSIPTIPNQSIHEAWQEGQVAGNATNIQGYGIQLTGEMSDWSTKGFDRKSAAPSIKTYNINRNLWVGVPSTLAPFNDPSNAYMVFVRGDRSANATNSPETPTVLRTQGELKLGDQAKVSVPADKFVAIGNPYAAPLDMAKIKTDGNVFFYVWDQNLGNNYGAYQTFMKVAEGEYMAVPGGGTYTTLSQNIIPSGQAFFVYNGNGGTVTIDESSKADMNAKSNSRTMATNSQMEIADQLSVKLYSVSNTGSHNLVDGIFQNFSKDFNRAIDGNDALKSANTGENLSVKTAGKFLAIESKSFSENSDTTVLNMAGMSYTTYRFEIGFNQANADRDVVLVDKYTNKRTIINAGVQTSYEFQVINNPGSYAANRFEIIYVPKRVLPVTFVSVKAEKKHEAVNVNWTVENQVNVQSYNIERSNDGSSFTQIGNISSANVSSYNFSDVNPASGVNYYRVVSVDLDGRKGYTSVVKVSMSQLNDRVAVYPNPIVGNNVHLEMKFQTKGIYYISIKNQIGQVVENRQVDYNGNKTNFDINPSTKLSSGVYTVEVVHPTGDHSVVRFIK